MLRQTVGMTTGSARPGALVLVGTPIGNLGDLSPRAAETLAGVDAIACEDTRRTGRLLAHIDVTSPELLVANEHTEADVADDIVGRVAAGERIALVSDAGMPTVSDPGQRVVAAVLDAGVAVEVVPGPSALDTAVALSGLPSGRFSFEGFLPRKGRARTERLAAVAAADHTVVLYEAPHRLARTLDDLADVCDGDRRVAVLRELTKLHEEHWRGTLAGARARVAEVEPRGEYVLVLAGREPDPEPDDAVLRAALDAQIEQGTTTRDAVDAVTRRFGVRRRRVYDLAVTPGDEATTVES